MMKRGRTVRLALAWAGAMAALGMLSLWTTAYGPPHPTTDVQAATVTAPLAGEMSVDQSGPDTAFAGEVIAYTIWFTNNTANILNGVEIQDTWNTDMYQASSPTSKWWERGILAMYESYAVTPPDAVTAFTQTLDMSTHSGEAVWQLAPVSPGASVRIVFSVTVPITLQPALGSQDPWGAVGPSRLGNSVVATAPGLDNAAASPVQTSIVGPLLYLKKNAEGETTGLGSCRVGKLLTYTVNVQNVTQDGWLERSDAWRAEHLVITEELPADVRGGFITASATVSGVMVTYDGRYIQWVYPDDYVLMPDQSTTISFVVRVPYTITYYPNTTYLNNEKTALVARADHMPLYPSNSATLVRTKILSPFDKGVETPPQPSGTRVYPGGIITYTFVFYNPLQRAIDSNDYLLIEDDLYPGFVFSDVVAGATPTQVRDGTHLEWENATVPKDGVLTSTFRVTVPVWIMPSICSGGEVYGNAITATFGIPGVGPFPGHDKNRLAQVTVEAAIKLDKSAEPATPLYGELVTYTIKLSNVSDRPLTATYRITDILPMENDTLYFTYDSMVSPTLPPGEPVSITLTPDGQRIVWLLTTTIQAGSYYTFAFRAVANGTIYRTYYNDVYASTGQTTICPATNKAKATIQSPFAIDKSTSLTTVVQGENFQYVAQISHISDHGIFTVTQFEDDLNTASTGMVDALDGDSIYQYNFITTPVELHPGNDWSHAFVVTAAGSGLGTAWCEARGGSNPTIAQDTGAVRFRISETLTNATWYLNANALADITVLPHVSLWQEASPNPVAVSQALTIRLTLHDNRVNPISDVTGIQLRWEIPHSTKGDFVFVTSTIPYSRTSGYYYYWDDLTLPKGSELNIDINAIAPWVDDPEVSLQYYSNALVEALDDPSICIPGASGFGRGLKIILRKPGIRIDKTPSPGEVGPYGEVVYTLKATNQTGGIVHNVRITDTLPEDWRYLGMVNGPNPVSEDPLVWQIDTIQPEDFALIEFKARAYVRFRTEINRVEATAPIHIAPSASYTDAVGVTVRPGIGFFKDVAPRDIEAGQCVVYTITLHNAETFALKDIFITDTLPAGFTYAETLQGPRAFYNPDYPRIVKWSGFDTLYSNKSQSVVFRACAGSTLADGVYYNEAEVYALNNDTGEQVYIPPTGPSAPVDVTSIPMVRLYKAAAPQAVVAGGSLVYTITLVNEVTSTHTVALTDTLDTPFSYTAMLVGPTPVVSGSTLIWNALSITEGETISLAFRVEVATGTAAGRYCNPQVVERVDGDTVYTHTALACVDVEAQQWDLRVGKTDGAAAVEAGQWVTYTLSYWNAGNMPLTGVVLTETFTPTAVMAAVAAPGWSPVTAGIYTRSLGSLAPGASGSVTWAVRLTDRFPLGVDRITNTVRGGHGDTETSPADNEASDEDTVVGLPSPTLSKVVTPTDVDAGSSVIYTLTLHNPTADTLTWRVTDTLPISFSYAVALTGTTPTTATRPDGRETVIWSRVTVSAGERVTLAFRAAVSAQAAGGVACNDVAATGATAMALDQVACVVVVGAGQVRGDARITKDNGLTTVEAGQWLTYTIPYTNVGGITLTQVVITDSFAPVAAIGTVVAPDWSPVTTGVYTFAVGTLPPGASGQVTWAVRLADRLPGGTEGVTNTVTLGYTRTVVDVTPWDNTATDADSVRPSPPPTVTKRVSPSVARAGTSVVYTLTLHNPALRAYTVQVTDTLPLSFTYVTVTAGPAPTVLSAPGGREAVLWPHVTLTAGQEVVLAFRAAIAPYALGGRYGNDVAVGGDGVDVQRTDMAVVTVQPAYGDAQLTKTDGVTTALSGQWLIYTLTVRNARAVTLTGVVLTDTLTPMAAIASVHAPGWTETATGVYTLAAGTLPPDASQAFTLGVRLRTVLPAGAVRITNTAAVGYEALAEMTPADNGAVDVDVLRQTPILTVTKQVTPATVEVGGNVVYTITLENPTAWPYTVTVTDTLPLGMHAVAALVGPSPVTMTLPDGREAVVWPALTASADGVTRLVFRVAVTPEATEGTVCNDVDVRGAVTQSLRGTACVQVRSAVTRGDGRIGKSDGVVAVRAGEWLTYVIPYTNAGSITLTQVVITDSFAPVAAVDAVAAPGWSPVTTGVYTLAVGTLLPGASGQVTWAVRLADPLPPDVGRITNTVALGYGSPLTEATPADNVAADVDAVQRPLTLTVAKVAAPSVVDAGDAVIYTITVGNPTVWPLTMRVTDRLPFSLTYVAMLVGPAPMRATLFDGHEQLVWDGISVAAGDAITLVFRVRVAAQAPGGPYCNDVAAGSAGVEVARTATACVTVVGAGQQRGDGRIGKSDGVVAVRAGEWLTYVIPYTNAGSITLTQVVITDSFAPVAAVDAVAAPGWSPVTTGVYTLAVGTLLPGASGQVTWAVRLADPLPPDVGRITNTVALGYGGNVVEVTPSDNAAADVDAVEVAPPTGTVTKAVAPSTVEAGGSVVYTLTLTNVSAQAYTVTVTDTLPLAFTYAAMVEGATPTTATLPDGREAVVWEGVTPTAYGMTHLVFRAAVSQAASGTACNDVDVGGAITLSLRGVACVRVSGGAVQVDAQIAKSDGVAWAHAGETLTYTLRYTNASDVALTGVVITESITPTAYVTVLPLAGWTQVGEGLYRREVGTLAARAGGTVSFAVRLATALPTTTASLVNRATITHATAGVVEVNAANDVAVDVDGLYGPDLVVRGVRLEPTTLISGRPYTVYVRVANVGNVPVTKRWDGSEDWWIFITGLYVKGEDGAPPADPFDRNGLVCNAWMPPLGAGEEVERICIPLPGSSMEAPPAGNYVLYVQVDTTRAGDPPWGQPFGLVQEAVEGNNLFGPRSLRVIEGYALYLPLVLRQ